MSDTANKTRPLKFWQGINQALVEEMERDERVVLVGEDVGRPGGPYGVTRGLLDKFGDPRVRDTPISEAVLVGLGVGGGAVGLRPVVEIMFFDFAMIAMDQIVNQAAKYRYFSRQSLPLVRLDDRVTATQYVQRARSVGSFENLVADQLQDDIEPGRDGHRDGDGARDDPNHEPRRDREHIQQHHVLKPVGIR